MKTPAIIFALTFISSMAFAQSQVSKVITAPGGSGGGAAAASYAATGRVIAPADSNKTSKEAQQKAALLGGAIPGGSVISTAVNKGSGKQTQGTTFGEKVNQGLHSAGSAVANGAAKTDNPLYSDNGHSQENPLHKSAAKTANPGNPIGGIIVKGGKN